MRLVFRGLFRAFAHHVKSHIDTSRTLSCQVLLRRPFSVMRDDDDEDPETRALLESDSVYEPLIPHTLRPAITTGLSLLVIQPKIKYGPEKTELYTRTTPQLQLEECIALVESLEDWKVVDSIFLSTMSLKSKIIRTGQQEAIKAMISKNKLITGVMLGVDVLPGKVQSDLEDVFSVPIFDRYSIVLQIFRSRAKTREARLQVSLAELSYIKSRFRQTVDRQKEDIAGVKMTNIGVGKQPYHIRIEILKERERLLRKAIQKLKDKRSVIRNQRMKNKIPTVAVVGYTNCGKSTLIKSLTKNPNIQAKDTLFHTLDIKVFEGRLKNMNQVLFMDTIGFIANLPTGLIESFKATLEEVTLADLVVHLSDVSHPDVKNQRLTVLKTLKDMQLGSKLSTTMIEVGNKIDKMKKNKKEENLAEFKTILDDEEEVEEEAVDEKDKSDNKSPKDLGPRVDLLVSATEGTNMDLLQDEIEKRLFVSLGCFFKRLRVANGGHEYQWLIRNAFILKLEVDENDENFVLITSRMTEAVAGKFRKQFPHHSFFSSEREEEIS